VFALRLLHELRTRHGWDGSIVLAGPRVERGSSRAEEEALLRERPDLGPVVEYLGAVAEDEKRWLLENASAVVYPTVYEGFGLVPFEAAAAGTPCLWAPQASLAEVLPAELAALVAWDLAASAERALPLLRDEVARRRQVEEIRRAEARLPSWDDHAAALLELYEQAARAPFREASAVAWQALPRERELAGWNELKAELGEEGFGLVGPEGYLPPDVQRALLSVVTRPRLRDALFAALRGLYRVGRRARRGR
jgi:Glycosyl transferases group 1